MGKIKGPYIEEFPVGTVVRIQTREFLEQFSRDWKWHHPLESDQLKYANSHARIKAVSFYHGGDELYVLENVPGIWHEGCLISCAEDCEITGILTI